MNKLLILFALFISSFVIIVPLYQLFDYNKFDSVNTELKCKANERVFVFPINKNNHLSYSINNKINPNNINKIKFNNSVKKKQFIHILKRFDSYQLIETINLLNPQEFEDVSNFLIFNEEINLEKNGYCVACARSLKIYPNGIINSRMVNILKVGQLEFYSSFDDLPKNTK